MHSEMIEFLRPTKTERIQGNIRNKILILKLMKSPLEKDLPEIMIKSEVEKKTKEI